jgi:hypothetical protein
MGNDGSSVKLVRQLSKRTKGLEGGKLSRTCTGTVISPSGNNKMPSSITQPHKVRYVPTEKKPLGPGPFILAGSRISFPTPDRIHNKLPGFVTESVLFGHKNLYS